MWFTYDDWNQLPFSRKLLNYGLIAYIASLWILVIIRICSDFHSLSTSRISDGVSMCLGGCMTLSSLILLAYTRQPLTEVVMAVEKKYLTMAEQSDKFAVKVRMSYRKEFLILCVALVVGFIMGVVQPLYMLVTGNLFYDTALPLTTDSFTGPWWLQMVYQASVPVLSSVVYSLKEFLLLVLNYYLMLMFTQQSEVVMELCRSKEFKPEEEYQKLRVIAQETCELLG